MDLIDFTHNFYEGSESSKSWVQLLLDSLPSSFAKRRPCLFLLLLKNYSIKEELNLFLLNLMLFLIFLELKQAQLS